jgi:tetratricopeptide (TPR) repeat protein
MSNERRHELEKNDLAILLDRVSKAIEPYSMMIALGVGALFIGGIVWLLYNSEQSGDRSVATLELIQGAASQDSEVLMGVSEDYPGTVAASWAKVYQGQLQLSQGIQTLYRDQEEAKQLLSDSKLAFESAIKDDSDQLLRSRSYLGIARADESLRNFEEATKAYEQVVSIAESEAMIKHAEQRIAALGDPKTEEFMVWFNDQDFAPADPSLPPSMPGLDTLPDMPELSTFQLQGGTGSIGDGDELDLVETEEAGSDNPEDAEDKSADKAGSEGDE